MAPMWTPERERLLLDLCGEIGDEDTSLFDRAEERAERFDGYRENRAQDASAAHASVAAITDNIPLGQPILLGHHSARRARKDAERIENGMRKAVNLWETSQYWQRRAKAALLHAQYKELPDVRHRRIKKIEADLRKQQRTKAQAEQALALWLADDLTHDDAVRLAGSALGSFYVSRVAGDKQDFSQSPSAYSVLTNSYPTLYAQRTVAEVVDEAKKVFPRIIAYANSWISHYENRIAYERAMLDEQGGLVAESVDMVPGGRVLVRGEWLTIIRITKKAGKVVSVTTNARFVPVRGIEEIKGYQAPTAEVASAVASVTKLPPMCNYPSPDFVEMTMQEWKQIHDDYKGSRELGKGAAKPRYESRALVCTVAENVGRHRVRFCIEQSALRGVYITDQKRKDPPTIAEDAPVQAPAIPAPEKVLSEVARAVPDNSYPQLDALRQQLKAGVKVVTAPQLFPTPADLADRMVKLAKVRDHDRILEPSAGTGRIIDALRRTGLCMHIVAVEINTTLAQTLHNTYWNQVTDVPQEVEVIPHDFLELKSNIGEFDCILMNPPFANADDIKHIQYAFTMLKPGGCLVAICANGSRQNAQLRPFVEKHRGIWEVLPTNTFAESGTGVNTVLLKVTAPDEEPLPTPANGLTTPTQQSLF